MTKSVNQTSKENIYSLQGFGKVFRFTFRQTIKNKAFLITAIVMILMMAMMKPLMYLMSNSSESTRKRNEASIENVEADKLYILNETTFAFDKEAENIPSIGKVKEGHLDPKNISIYNKDEVKEDDLITGLTGKDILVVIRLDAMTYHVDGIITDNSEVSVRSLDRATEYVEKIFGETRKSQMSLDDQSLKSISAGVTRDEVMTAKEYVEEKDHTISKTEYSGLLMGFALIIMVVASLSSSYIISSVNEEKTSKLAETLLVSVRPMALLLGKVLGMLLFVAGTIVCGILLSFLVSDVLMENVLKLDMSGITQQGGLNLAIFTGYGVKGLVVFLAEILLALCSFGILSGIMGSACSKTEDQQNATTLVTVITLIGWMGCTYVGMKGDLSAIGALVPPFSYFMAPEAYVAGRIGIGVLLLSFAIQIAILIGLLIIGAKTYRNLLLSDSSKPKLASIFAAAKN